MGRFFYDDLTWKPNVDKTSKPIYRAIADALWQDIRSGTLRPGDQLPPQRELADFLDVNLSTVTRAFKICEPKGVIYATVGRGTFVSSDVLASAAGQTADGNADTGLTADLGMIYPLYNEDERIVSAMRSVAMMPQVGEYLSYDAPKRREEDGKIGAEWLEKMRLSAEPENIFTVSGVQNALAIILTSLFSAGDRIATDRYTYSGFKNLAYMLGIRLVPVDADEAGMGVNSLLRACRSDKIKGLYLMPECQNPTSATMTLERRRELAQVIRGQELILIEDDTYAFLQNTEHPPVSAMTRDRSVYIGGTSKALSAGLRVAFLAVADAFHRKIETGLRNINLMTSRFNTEIVAHLIRTGAADEAMARKRAEAERLGRLADEALEGFDMHGNRRDYFRWLSLPGQWSGREFEMAAGQAGVKVFCAEKFVVGSEPAASAVRVSLTAAKGEAALLRGLAILRALLERQPEEAGFII